MNSWTKKLDIAVGFMLLGILFLLAALMHPLLGLPAAITPRRLFTLFVVCLVLAIYSRVAQLGLQNISRRFRKKQYLETVTEGLIVGGVGLTLAAAGYSVFIGGLYAHTVTSSPAIMAALAMIVLGVLLVVVRAGASAIRTRLERAQYVWAGVHCLVLLGAVGLLGFAEWRLLLNLVR